MSEEKDSGAHIENESKNKNSELKKKEKLKNAEGVIPEEILEKIPPEFRRDVKQSLSMIRADYVSPTHPPFVDKINEEHITQLIESAKKDGEREFEENRQIRKTGLIIFFTSIFFVGFLLVFFTLVDKPQILIPVVTSLLSFGAGFGVGRIKR